MGGPNKIPGPVCASKPHSGTITDGTSCLQQSPVRDFRTSCSKPVFKAAKCITPQQALRDIERIPSNQVSWKVGVGGVTQGWIRKGGVIPTPQGDLIIMGVAGYYHGHGGLIYIRKGQLYELPLTEFHNELRFIGTRTAYSRAEGMMVLLRAEMDFLIGVISVATGTALIIALVEGGKVISESRRLIQRLPAVVIALLAARKVFKKVAPNLYSYIFDTLLDKVIDNIPLATAKVAASVVVARYAGKMVGSLGWNGFQSKFTMVKNVSMEIISFILFKGVPGAIMAVKDDYQKLGSDLITALRKIGAAALSEPNAAAIAKEIMNNKAAISKALKEIVDAVEGIERRREMTAAEIASMKTGLEVEAELFRNAPPGAF